LIVKFLPLLLILILTSCSDEHKVVDPYNGLSLEKVVTNYLSFNSIVIPGKDFSISVEEDTKGCLIGTCGTVWVNLGNMKLPLVYQKISGHFFFDGLAVNGDGSTLRVRNTPVLRKPKMNPSNSLSSESIDKLNKLKSKSKIDKTFVHDPSSFNYIVFDKSNNLSVRIVCDIGIQYCSHLIGVAASLPHVNIEYLPFSMNDKSLFFNSLMASSPLSLRYEVFRFLSHSLGLKNEDLLPILKKRLHVDISSPVLEMNKKRLKQLKVRLENKGVKLLPTTIFADGSVLVGMPKSEKVFRDRIGAGSKSK